MSHNIYKTLLLKTLGFFVAAAVGTLRLPDMFTRSHAVSLTDSFGRFSWGARNPNNKKVEVEL